MRYLDPGLSPASNEAELLVYAAALGAEYDAVGVPLEELSSGDVIVTGPWVDWSWLPVQVGIECHPDQTPPNSRVDPIIVALHERGAPVAFRNNPPKTPRSKHWNAYHEAVAWVENVASLVNIDASAPRTSAPYEVVTEVERAVEVLRALHGKPFAFDFETDGLDPRKITRIGLAVADHEMAWWLTDTVTPAILPELISLLQDPDCEPRASGVNYDHRVLMAAVPGYYPTDMQPVWDTQVMHWVWAGGSYVNDLKSLTRKILKEDVLTFDDVGGPEHFWEQSLDTQATYAAAGDARHSYDLVTDLTRKLRTNGTYELYRDIELPVTPVLAEMQFAGLPLDRGQLYQLVDEYEQRRDSVLGELAQRGFKGSATRDGDIIRYLFEEIGLPVLSRTAKKRQPQVSTDVLRQTYLLGEVDPLVAKHTRDLDLFIEFSEIDKALSTFLYPPLISLEPYLRASIKQTSTVTGRISTSNPNIMNIPSRAGKRIRQMVVAPSGKLMVDSDYSTLEPRIGAHMSQDPKMMEDFLQGRDVYISLAYDMGLGVIEKGSVQRDNVKTVYLADLYGTSPVKIQVIALKDGRYLSIAEARDYQRGIHAAREGYYTWRDGIVNESRRNGGYVYDMFGRWRRVRQLFAVDPGSRGAGEREVMNFPNQAGAGGVIKGAMPSVQALFRSAGGTLINQIHDELLGWVDEMPESQQKEFAHEMERLMCWYELSVPLKAETGFGHSWYDAKQ